MNEQQPIYNAKELGTGKTLVLGVQHLFAMFGATVLVPLLTGLSVSATLLFAGLATLFCHFVTGRKIPDILAEDGEEAFRRLETAALEEAGRESGCIIATGGGCVTKERNDPLLHQNSTVVWIRRDLRLLPADGRPLSASCTAEALYEQRKDRYAEFADLTVENNDTVEDAAERILEKLERS